MEERKSFLADLAETVKRHWPKQSPSQSPRWMRWLGRQLMPNLGSVLLVLVLLTVFPGLAAPFNGINATSVSTIPYQGRLADASGSPVTGKQNMEFRIYSVPTGGTPLWEELWTGANSVDVSDGLFSVMLGSIDTGLISVVQGNNNLYLGITVGTDSEMAPRVQLGSVPFSIWSLTVADDSITNAKIADNAVGSSEIADNTVGSSEIADNAVGSSEIADNTVGSSEIADSAVGSSEIADGSVTSNKLYINGAVDMRGNSLTNVYSISKDGNILNPASGETAPSIRIISQNGAHIFIDADNDQTDRTFSIRANSGAFVAPGINLLEVNEVGDLWVRGSITHGALIERNLQTAEEATAERITRFSEGDVLCWVEDHLELCTQIDNPLVQAVADNNGKPIVLGAEPIKVLGPIQIGDLLVASDTPGYAMVNNNPSPGTVIAQALEPFEGERGIIKAMIRKF